MESQIPRHQGRDNDEHIPSVGLPSEGQDDHRQEKTSVMRKVKAKAKKIKETLTKGYGHGHEHDRTTPHEEEECEDEDEETVEDPDVHGAPMYESAAVMSAVGGQQPGVNLEKPRVAADDRYDSKYTDPPPRPFGQSQDGNSGGTGAEMGRSTAMGLADHVPENRDVSFSSAYGSMGSGSRGISFGNEREENMGQPKINLGTQTAMEEDPHAPKDRPEVSNYQTKVTDPTGAGGEEAGITPILSSLNKLNVHDEPSEPKPKSEGAPTLYTGSHDQFSPEPLPPHSTVNPDDPGSALKSLTEQPSNQSGGYTEKISAATSAITGRAIAAKNVVASKLGYGGTNEDHSSNAPSSTQGVVATVTETLAPVDEKAANVGNTEMSKVRGSETEQGREYKGEDKGVSVKESWAEKLRPGEEDKALSEVISDALPKRKQGGEMLEEREMKAEEKPAVGKVTESEEVKKRLGTSSDDREEMTERESSVAANVSATGKGMVDSVKGAVRSWFAPGGDQSQTSQPSLGTAHGDEQFSSSPTGEAAGHGDGGGGGVVGEAKPSSALK